MIKQFLYVYIDHFDRALQTHKVDPFRRRRVFLEIQPLSGRLEFWSVNGTVDGSEIRRSPPNMYKTL